jgi:hypothetical protein
MHNLRAQHKAPARGSLATAELTQEKNAGINKLLILQ